MHGRFAAPQVVVVHRRQIVMHERECMNQLDRNGGCIEQFGRNAEALAGRVHE